MSRKPGQITIPKPLCDLESLLEGRVSSREIACVDATDCIEDEQIAANDTVVSGFIEEASCPRDPPAARSRRTTMEESECQPQRAARGGLAVAALQVCLVRPVPRRFALRVPACQVRGSRQRLEILGFERLPRVSLL
jgi:hypothetical protein